MPFMDGTADKPARAVPQRRSQQEADDRAYVAWVKRKIRQGQKDLKDPAKRHSEVEVWREHGFED